MTGMRAEEEAAFEAFVVRSAPALLRTAVALVGDRGHAEDLLQTAYERVARRWRSVGAEPEAYARVVLARLAVDRWRRRRARPVEVEVSVDLPAVAGMSRVEDADALVRALATLPVRQRAVLVLRYLDDRSDDDIAAALGISRGTVRSTAHRGLASLRLVFDDEGVRR